jgi:hypothetical protein
MPTSSTPWLPPTSTTFRMGEKSYAAATAIAVIAVNEPMASSKTAPSSGCCSKYSNELVSNTRCSAVSPVRTVVRSSPHDFQIIGPAKSCAAARNDPGPVFRNEPTAVSSKRPSSRSFRTPAAARSRSTRRSDGACVLVAFARASCVCGPSARWSAIPSLAAT